MPGAKRHVLGTPIAVLKPLRKDLEPHAQRLCRRAEPNAAYPVAAITSLCFAQNLRLGPLGEIGDVLIDRTQHRGMLLQSDYVRRRVLDVARAELGNVTAPLLLCPELEGLHGNFLDAQGWKDTRNVPDEGVVEDDDEHLVRTEALRILKCEVGKPVKPDRRLAASGAALNDDEPRGWLADQVELTRVDERGDLGKMLVLAQIIVANAEPRRADGATRGASPRPAPPIASSSDRPRGSISRRANAETCPAVCQCAAAYLR